MPKPNKWTREYITTHHPESASQLWGSTSKERSCATDSQNKPQAVKKNKYRNRKVFIDGIQFDSVKESNRWLELKQMQADGEIFSLFRQQKFILSVNGYDICTYISDFDYWKNGVHFVEDVKSSVTRKIPTYRLKKKLLKAIWNIDINEV